MGGSGKWMAAVLCIVWWFLTGVVTGGDAGSGFVDNSVVGEGTLCPACQSRAIEAECVVNFDSRTIACSVNTSSCGISQCAPGSHCHMIFSRFSEKWAFSSLCFPLEVRKVVEHCVLETAHRLDVSFPPEEGLMCSCRDCSLDQTFLYVHQEPPIDPNVTSSFSLLTGPRTGPSSFPPSPTNTIEDDDGSDGSHSSSLHTSYIAAIVSLILLVLMLTIAAIAIYICLQRKKNSFTHNVEEF